VNTVTMWATTIIAVGGAVGVIWKFTRPVIKKTKNLLNSLDKFVRDWEGEEEEPGRAKVPGVMERLNRIDGELKHNGGSSMKDSMKRIEKKLNEIDARLDDGAQMFTSLDSRLGTVEDKLDL
jgi:hypothetical protein